MQADQSQASPAWHRLCAHAEVAVLTVYVPCREWNSQAK